jgi:hypothetical protein
VLLLLAFQALLGGLLLACVAWTAYVLACRLTPTAPASVRWAAAVAVAIWLLVALFLLLASLGLFRLPIAVALWLASATMAHVFLGGQDALRQFRKDLESVLGLSGSLPRTFQVLLGVVLSVAIVRAFRGLVAPPLAWDALTYHLLKAGRWVQAGTFTPEAAPDAWGYYEYFMPYGDVLWAWAMLPVHGDALLAPAGMLVWLTLALGAYVTASGLRARRELALVGAAIVASTPTVMNYLTGAYVENLTAAIFLIGAAFITRALQRPDRRSFLLSGAALGLGAGVKIVSLPYLVLGLALLGLKVVGVGRPGRQRMVLLAACVLPAAIALPPYVRAWVEMGSPTYPIGFNVGSWVIASGNEEMDLLHAGKLGATRAVSLGGAVARLLIPNALTMYQGREFLGLGPAAALLFPFGLLGAWIALRCQAWRLPALYLLASGFVTVLSILPRSNVALRTYWIGVLARHLIVPFAVVVLLALTLGDRIPRLWLTLALSANLVLVLPIGWDTLDSAAVALLLAWGLWGCSLVLLGDFMKRRGHLSPVKALTILALLAVPYFGVLAWRQQSRYRYYQRAAEGRVYDVHPVESESMAAWPVWLMLDRDEGATVAAAAGWNGVGHNWLRYPLLGSRFQNRVVYVPVTRDGSVIDYRNEEALRTRADFNSWVNRLAAAKVDYVAILWPDPLEGAWARARPDLFSLVAVGSGGLGRLYRFQRERAAATRRLTSARRVLAPSNQFQFGG